MASIYTRPKSPFYWIKYRDPATERIERKSTGIRLDARDASRLARRKEAEYTQRETIAPKTRERERWEAWADTFLANRYQNPSTLTNARKALRDLLAYFRARSIRTPAQLTYEHAAGFIPWRTSGQTLKPISINTAKLRFLYLQILMSEAVKRGYAAGNPCREVKTSRQPPKQKLEITADHQIIIETALKKKPAWMRAQWLILMRQGCRVGETDVTLDRIDTDARTITLRIKGGRHHTQALHPDLLPLISEAREQGRASLLPDPPLPHMWSPCWSDFFRRRALPYSIHCTRVTIITRLLRAGHSTSKIASFIGHSEEINKIYRRLQPSDAHPLLTALGASPSQA